MSATYDEIGVGYALTRQPDPRIGALIAEALGNVGSLVNVGAGTGSYEPGDRRVVAVEPSREMIGQRPEGAAPAVCAVSEHLPLAAGAVDAALAILTMHHWTDRARGLAEMRRVARRRVVVFTWDQAVCESFWLIRDYLPAIRDFDRPRAVPIDEIVAALGPSRVVDVPVPHDCEDGFLGAFWRRPEAYLDPRVQAGISSMTVIDQEARDRGLSRLADDLRSGAWSERNGDLLDRETLDIGYRLVVTG